MITAVGNPVYDHIETPEFKTDTRILSGCSTNAAIVLSKLGADVRLIGCVGGDFRSDFENQMAKNEIEFKTVPSIETGGFSLIYYDNKGNRTLDIINRADNIENIKTEWYKDSKAVLVGPILGEISFSLIESIRENYNGLLFCDPQGLLRNADDQGRIYHEKPEGIEEILARFEIVKPNELEGKILTGIDCRRDPHQAASIIKEWGPQIVIITLAELGSIIYDGRKYIQIPPFEVDLIDSTGAGDSYMGAFVHEYIKTGDLYQSGIFASAVASMIVEQIGPDFIINKSALNSRILQLDTLRGYTIPL